MDEDTLKEIAVEYGTPVYVYDGDVILERYRDFAGALAGVYKKTRVFYAAKANTSLAILALLRSEGAGADCVSGGEVASALKAGFTPQDIIFTSNSKSSGELSNALNAGVIITVGNTDELRLLSGLAEEGVKTARVSFRVNPDVDPKTHPKIATGLRESKFGLHFEGDAAFNACRTASGLDGINVVGLHAHIGSQILDPSGFVEAAGKVFMFAKRLKDELSLELEFIDLGGGVGIKYGEEDTPLTPAELALALKPAIEDGVSSLGSEPHLYFEPGRYIVGPAGVLLATANSVKETPAKKFVNVDAGFNTLARPVMYGGYHRVSVLRKTGESQTYDIAGNVCESGDILAKDRRLPEVVRGDIIVFHDTGAYGFSMASEYNSRPLPAEVLVKAGRKHLIRERGTFEGLWTGQNIPKEI